MELKLYLILGVCALQVDGLTGNFTPCDGYVGVCVQHHRGRLIRLWQST